MFSTPTAGELDLPVPTVSDATELVAEVPFEIGIEVLALLAGEIYHHARDRARQVILAREFYREPVLTRVLRFVAGAPTRLAFDERHVLALQRLIVEHGAPGRQLPSGLDANGVLRRLGGALLALATALPSPDPPEPPEGQDPDWEAWTQFTTQSGSWYDLPYVLEGMSRAHAMYVEIAGEPALEAHHAYCDIDRWMREAYDLDIGDQLAVGLAYGIGSGALDPDLSLAERRARRPARGFLRSTALADREEPIVERISATREELRHALQAGGTRAAHLAWDHAAFEQKPFLRLETGELLLLTPRALVSWLTRGMHYRLLDAGNAQTDRKGRLRGKSFLDFTGTLGERYVHRLIDGSHAAAQEAGAVRVLDEFEYYVSRNRCDSPDVTVESLHDVVFVEVFSGRLPRAARTTGDPSALREALGKSVVAKLAELADRTRDFVRGDLVVADVELAAVKRVWPVLVLAGDSVMQTPVLWGYLRQEVPTAFSGDARVQRPVIADLDDLEPLMALVEEGHTFCGLLDRFIGSRMSELPPRNWVQAEFKGIRARARYVDNSYEAASVLAAQRLYPDSPRLIARLAETRPAA